QKQNNTVDRLENGDNSSENNINIPNLVIKSLEDDTPASDITDDTSNSDIYLSSDNNSSEQSSSLYDIKTVTLETNPKDSTEVGASPEEKGYQVLSEKINNLENRKNSKNNTLNLFPLKNMLSKKKHKEVINKLTMHFTDSPKLDLYFSIDKKGEHQSDAYWVLGSHCPLCRENHMSLQGIPLDEVLKAYHENAVPNQPIVRNHALKFPDKSIA
ncbi:15819_t:CDS:2, partial [Gigaspora margarita]